MPSTFTDHVASSHRERLETVRPRMAKALNNLEVWKIRVGHAIQRSFSLAGISQKEAAALLERDPAQVARWIAGSERPQFDVLLGVAEVRPHLVIALAELAGESVEIATQITVRRRIA